MTDAPLVPAEKLEQLGRIPTQTLIDALWVKQWPQAMIHGARPLFPGRRMAGRAVTLRFVPHRPDVAADKPKGEASPEYVAFELCGPEEVLVGGSVVSTGTSDGVRFVERGSAMLKGIADPVTLFRAVPAERST